MARDGGVSPTHRGSATGGLEPTGELGPSNKLIAGRRLSLLATAVDPARRVTVSWLRTEDEGLRPNRMLEVARIRPGGVVGGIELAATERFIKGGELTDATKPVIVWERKRDPRSRPRIKALALRRDGTVQRSGPVSTGVTASRTSLPTDRPTRGPLYDHA